MNVDCWLRVLSNLTPRERRNVRLVDRLCTLWIDHLDSRQQNLRIVHHSQESAHWPAATSSTIEWSSGSFGYSDFNRLLAQYPRLEHIELCGVHNFADHHLFSLADHCPSLRKLEFYSCPQLSEYFLSEFGFHNVTQLGWQRLFSSIEPQLTTLTLEDCDLDNDHFRMIAQSLGSLRHLNIANNSQITDFSPLRTGLSSTQLEVLKVGPKLGDGRQQVRSLLVTDAAIEEIIHSPRCVSLKHLQLHGFLSPRLVSLVSRLKCLERLTLKYVSFDGIADGISTIETDILRSLLLNATRPFRNLNLYQINHQQVNDLHWFRERLTAIYDRASSVNVQIENPTTTTSSSSSSQCRIGVAGRSASSLPNAATTLSASSLCLESFTFYSNITSSLLDKWPLLELVLSERASQLREFCLTSSVQFRQQNEQQKKACEILSKSLLSLLMGRQHRLSRLQLENIVLPSDFDCLFQVLSTTCQELRNFSMKTRRMLDFLKHLNVKLSSVHYDDYFSSSDLACLSRILFGCCTTNIAKQKQESGMNSVELLLHHSSTNLEQVLKYCAVKREMLTQDEWNLRFIMEETSPFNVNARYLLHTAAVDAEAAAAGGGGGAGEGASNGHGSNSLSSSLSNENDLSDLCQLLDSSFGVIDHMVEFITLSTNYLVIVLTCAIMLKPTSLLNSFATSISTGVWQLFQNRIFRR